MQDIRQHSYRFHIFQMLIVDFVIFDEIMEKSVAGVPVRRRIVIIAQEARQIAALGGGYIVVLIQTIGLKTALFQRKIGRFV